jgi:hypothetical protein
VTHLTFVQCMDSQLHAVKSGRQICCDETMPRRTVFQWLEKHPEFAELYGDQAQGIGEWR